jgi:hypothetical protein
MSSGFIEIEGGSQPSLPTGDFIRIWKDNADNSVKILKPNGRNVKISDITSEPIKNEIQPDDEILIYDITNNAFRKMKAKDIAINAVSIDRVSYEDDDFTTEGTDAKLNWRISTNGTGASVQPSSYGLNGTERVYGVLQIDTGTTSNGRCTLYRLLNRIQMGYCSFDQTWRLAVEELSTPTDRFLCHFGFIDNLGTGEHTDGVYFRYSDNLNLGRWQCVCREGNIETSVNTNIAANTNYNVFRIIINENATQATFFINGDLVATINTNLPSTQGNFTGIGIKIEKQLGTTERFLSIDYFKQICVWSSER